MTHPEGPQQYANSLTARVRSFHTDPLHSTAYLAEFAWYLQKPYEKGIRNRVIVPSHTPCYPFVLEYRLSSKEPQLRRFTDINDYNTCKSSSESGNCLVFLTGRPSPEWLNAVNSITRLFFFCWWKEEERSMQDWAHFLAARLVRTA